MLTVEIKCIDPYTPDDIPDSTYAYAIRVNGTLIEDGYLYGHQRNEGYRPLLADLATLQRKLPMKRVFSANE